VNGLAGVGELTASILPERHNTDSVALG
jgi:hypothetical protein